MAIPQAQRDQVSPLRSALLEWYKRNRRALPWRGSRDPYAIWVSEIMLQQTRVSVVIEHYQAFMARFPTVFALGAAPEQEVLAAWSGLGYYRRARMLHKAAQVVVASQGGRMPETAAELHSLPGVGGYTSAAIASIAYGEPVAVVDGNVERVLCRLRGWGGKNGQGSARLQRRIEDLAAAQLDPESPGDFNQAMMELGATLCLPRNPQCLVCPVSAWCKTRGEHKTAPRPRIVNREAAYALCVRLAERQEAGAGVDGGEVLLEQRPASATVMPGLWELPVLGDAALAGKHARMTVRHAIMNVNYIVRIREVGEEDVDALTAKYGVRRWVPLREAGGMALTGLARKVLAKANLIAARDSHATAAPRRDLTPT